MQNLRGYLHRQPRDDCVGNRHFLNIAPLRRRVDYYRRREKHRESEVVSLHCRRDTNFE